MTTFHDFTAETISGSTQDLADYRGKVVLVVNTASKCGFTPQFEGLESAYRTFADEDFEVLGFPCNQFAGQELGDAEQIEDFCRKNYGVSFPMFAKVDVNGRRAHPLYKWMKSEAPGKLGGAIEWNFTKFLVGRDGQMLRRYSSKVEPRDIEADIRAALES